MKLQTSHSPCSLTRSLPLGSPFGPTFGCSISKAPPFRLWLNLLNSGLKEGRGILAFCREHGQGLGYDGTILSIGNAEPLALHWQHFHG